MRIRKSFVHKFVYEIREKAHEFIQEKRNSARI